MKNENITIFMNLWDEYDSLKNLKIWWDSIPVAFATTMVGKVLAHANAQRCDLKLPPLN